MRIKLLLRENTQQYWYNGSERPRLQWTTENVGKGNDQNGPGLFRNIPEKESISAEAELEKLRSTFMR